MGYFGEEIIIKFHKYLSLPFLLFAMIVLSTFFTIKMNFTFNNFIYAFLGILTGIIVYFFYDLSIAVGKNGKLRSDFISVDASYIDKCILNIYFT